MYGKRDLRKRMTSETEKILRRTIMELEAKNEEMRKRMQTLENMNYEIFSRNKEMSAYIHALEMSR